VKWLFSVGPKGGENTYLPFSLLSSLPPSLPPSLPLSLLGTSDVLSPHGVPVDLLDRMLIIR